MNFDTVLYIKRSENYSISPASRSAARHELMDIASETQDEELWKEIAKLLMRAHDEDDLTTQVSDHFVNACPDIVFVEFSEAGPSARFRKWRIRAINLMKFVSPE